MQVRARRDNGGWQLEFELDWVPEGGLGLQLTYVDAQAQRVPGRGPWADLSGLFMVAEMVAESPALLWVPDGSWRSPARDGEWVAQAGDPIAVASGDGPSAAVSFALPRLGGDDYDPLAPLRPYLGMVASVLASSGSDEAKVALVRGCLAHDDEFYKHACIPKESRDAALELVLAGPPEDLLAVSEAFARRFGEFDSAADGLADRLVELAARFEPMSESSEARVLAEQFAGVIRTGRIPSGLRISQGSDGSTQSVDVFGASPVGDWVEIATQRLDGGGGGWLAVILGGLFTMLCGGC